MLSQVIFCTLLLVAVSTSQPAGEIQAPVGRAGGSHNIILCDITDQGNIRLAYTQLFTREALFLQTRTETLYWPTNDLNFEPIVCIKVLDKIANNLGGYVQITRGGIAWTSVEFEFTSQWSRRMSFNIEIYTRKQ